MPSKQPSIPAGDARSSIGSRAAGRLVVRASGSASLSAAAATPWRSVLGPESRLPNVYWGALSPGSLRRLATFTALPPPEEVMLEGEASYRYVRQESPLWSALHAGRLTTSRFKDALGLRDRTAARMVGGPQFAEPGVIKAYSHLCQPLYVPPPSAGARAPVGGSTSQSAAGANEAVRMRFNELLERSGAAGGPLEAGEESWLGGGCGEAGWSEADRRRISEMAALAVGAAGAVRMRLLWGSLQEGAAVATLTALFPTSQIEEVGLLCLADPRPWGIEPGELPQLGASPDALITHHVAITHTDIETARAGLDCAAGGGGDAGEAARVVARATLRAALARHTQEAALALDAAGAGSSGSSAAVTPAAPGVPHPLTASYYESRSHPLCCNGSDEAVDWLAKELLRGPLPGAGAAGQLPAEEALLGEELRAARVAGGQERVNSPAASSVAAVVQLREVVEVKNHCPFVYKGQRKARKRGIVIDYAVSDRGPVTALWPLWVPQMQAHMACSGADSALLLSRSPSRGVRVFRMYRDDAYLASALELVRELQRTYVARGEPPGADPWVGRPGYQEFLQHTVAIARGSETVLVTKNTPRVPGTDSSAFWATRQPR